MRKILGLVLCLLAGLAALPSTATAASTTAVSTTAASTTASSTAAAPAPLIQLIRYDQYFDPHVDRAAFVFTLGRRAVVRALVYDRTGTIVREARLGQLAAGRHTWRWNGATRGRVVQPDGTYFVRLRAWTPRRAERTGADTTIVTRPDAGRLLMSRPTVYPFASVVRDRLALVYVRSDYSVYRDRYPGYFDPPLPLRVRLEIEAPDGELVKVATSRDYRPVFSWAARDGRGRPLAPGSYQLRLRVSDPLGHRRWIVRTVQVSRSQLAEQTWTSTMPAAEAPEGSAPTYDPSCNGCGEVCGPVPSERFPGGLSFVEPCSSWSYATVRDFAVKPPFWPAPVDSFRVSATGGPPVPDGPGVGHLDGIALGPGDDSVTTPWRKVDLTDYPYLPGRQEVATWRFATDSDNDYDVASFTLDYRHYVPVS